MLARLSLNQKKTDNVHAHQNKHYNEKQNNQKNLNRGKQCSRLDQLDSGLIVKAIEQKSYLTNTNKKMNISLNYNSIQPTMELRSKICSRNSLQKNKVQSVIPNQKRMSNTQQFCQLYGKDIIAQHQLKPIHKPDFLKNHQITPLLRARMLDWMVQVMKSYKFINKTYFAGAQLLDRYFIENKDKVSVSQLHITGVTAMYIATKMDQIYPLKIKTVYQKIVHKKIDKEAIIDMQMNILRVLGHKVNSWTFFDLALLKMADKYSTQDLQVKYRIQQVVSFISKCIVYDYNLYIRYDMGTFAKVLVGIASKIFNFPSKNEGYSISCHEQVIKSFKNFKLAFKGLTNIYKFTDQKCLNLVQAYFLQE